MNKVVISVLGKDRPGILAAVSGVLLSQDCNIENISQTILQSVFGALFIVAVPDNLDGETLQARLTDGLSELELDIYVKHYQSEEQIPVNAQAFVITTFGPDKPGLVKGITSIFAEHAINIANLKAVFKGGDDPHNNIMIFEVDVPDDINLPELRNELEQSALKLGLEINIQHRKIFETMNRI